MHEVLSRNIYLIKHAGKPGLSKSFDIYDPNSDSVMMECREENLGRGRKMFGATKSAPFDLQVRTPDGQPLVRVKRDASIFFNNVIVSDENDQQIGVFKQKFNLFGNFKILDTNGKLVCRLHPKMSGRDFRFTADHIELAHMTRKHMGTVKEISQYLPIRLGSPDNFVLSFSESVPPDSMVRQLILAAALCLDMAWRIGHEGGFAG